MSTASTTPTTRSALLAQRRESALAVYKALWEQMPRTREGDYAEGLRGETRETRETRQSATTKII